MFGVRIIVFACTLFGVAVTLPLDLAEELHLRGPDTPALEYRRRLKQLGVEWQ